MITIFPTIALTATNSKWQNPNNALGSGSFAYWASGSANDSLILENFTKLLPQDITISGIVVTITGGINAVTTAASCLVGLTLDGSTIASTTFSTINMSGSSNVYTLGSSGNTWGLPWKKPQFETPNFGVIIQPTGDLNTDREIYYVSVSIYYSLNTYLQGERSIFPPDISNWGKGLDIDSIPLKQNGSSSSFQIKSDDVNLLGDCLYEIETTLLTTRNVVRAIGPFINSTLPTIYANVITITGDYSVGASQLAFYNETVTRNMGTNQVIQSVTNHPNLTNITRTQFPIFPKNSVVNSYLVKGVGWLGDNTPLEITSATFYSARQIVYNNGSPLDVQLSHLGFIISSPFSNTSITQLNSRYGLTSSCYSPLATGTFTVKLFTFSFPVTQ